MNIKLSTIIKIIELVKQIVELIQKYFGKLEEEK